MEQKLRRFWVPPEHAHRCAVGLGIPHPVASRRAGTEPDSASPGGSLITSFTEERYANELKEGRTVRSVPAPNCGNQGTSVTSVLQSIDRCGTLIPGCTLTPPVAHPLPRGEGKGEG